MQELLKCREQIDEIDQKIARLFQDRMVISGNVAAYKRATGKKVFDKEREDSKIETLSGMVEGEFNKKCVSELFTQIMAMSHKFQYAKLEARERKVAHRAVDSCQEEASNDEDCDNAENVWHQAMQGFRGGRREVDIKKLVLYLNGFAL